MSCAEGARQPGCSGCFRHGKRWYLGEGGDVRRTDSHGSEGRSTWRFLSRKHTTPPTTKKAPQAGGAEGWRGTGPKLHSGAPTVDRVGSHPAEGDRPRPGMAPAGIGGLGVAGDGVLEATISGVTYAAGRDDLSLGGGIWHSAGLGERQLAQQPAHRLWPPPPSGPGCRSIWAVARANHRPARRSAPWPRSAPATPGRALPGPGRGKSLFSLLGSTSFLPMA
jgi:hypothetical protein